MISLPHTPVQPWCATNLPFSGTRRNVRPADWQQPTRSQLHFKFDKVLCIEMRK